MPEHQVPKMLQHLQDRPIVLASASPRRMEIMKRLNLPVRVVPSRFPETLDHGSFATASDYVRENAKQKGLEVRQRLFDEGELVAKMLIISADTIVVVENDNESAGDKWEILEKPSDPAGAVEMLRKLSGRAHKVMTAVHFLSGSDDADDCQRTEQLSFCEVSVVHFDELKDDLIHWYVETGEPFDKAGGYGYQSLGMLLVKRIEGCYYNVVGFPIQRLFTQLQLLK